MSSGQYGAAFPQKGRCFPLLARVESDYGERTTIMSNTDAQLLPPRSNPPKKKVKRSQSNKERAEALVKSFKQRLGMGDDPEDSSWLTFTNQDPATGDRVRAGELLVSVEILPILIARAREAGLGRSEPNNFPVLSEPADRLHLSAMWNPLYVLEAMMGPKYYRAFASAMVCASLVLILVFTGPLVSVVVTLLEMLPQPYGWVVLGLMMVLFAGSFVYISYRCRRALEEKREK